MGSREPEQPHWEQEGEQKRWGRCRDGEERTRGKAGMRKREGKLPLQERSQSPCAWHARFLPPLQTNSKLPLLSRSLEISTCPERPREWAPSTHGGGGGGWGALTWSTWSHLVASHQGCRLPPGLPPAPWEIFRAGPEAKKCEAARGVWGCRGQVITVVKGATAPGSATAAESATKDQAGPSF